MENHLYWVSTNQCESSCQTILQPVSYPAQFLGNEGNLRSRLWHETNSYWNGGLNQLFFDGTYVVGVQGIRHYIETAANVRQLEIKKAIISLCECPSAHENLKSSTKT